MKLILASGAALLLLTAPALAQTPAAPANFTALCKDGTSWSGKLKLAACHGHKGVKTWTSPAAPAPSAPTAAPAAAPAKAAAQTAKAAGGAGQVWVNTRSKVYHCPGDAYYGKTKQGQYMTESAALAAGAHADHGKACH